VGALCGHRGVFAADRFVDFFNSASEVGGYFVGRLTGNEALENLDRAIVLQSLGLRCRCRPTA
jgi:hypothetical protein